MKAPRSAPATRGVVFTALAILIVAIFGLFGGLRTGPSAEAGGSQSGGAAVAGELPVERALLFSGCKEPPEILIQLGLDPRQWFCVTETLTVVLPSTATTTTTTFTGTVTENTTEVATTTVTVTTELSTETTTELTTSTAVSTESTTTTSTAQVDEVTTLTNTSTSFVTKSVTTTIRCFFFIGEGCHEVNGTQTVSNTEN